MRMRSVIVSSLVGCGSWRYGRIGCGFWRRLGLLRTLANGDEEAVGTVACRGQAQHVAGARRLAADGRAPPSGERESGEIRRGGAKTLGLLLVLLAQERAGGLDKPPPGCDEAGGAFDDAVLQLGQLDDVVLREAPFGVGVTAPGAGAGAWRIDEDAVEAGGMALHPFVALASQDAALDDADAGTAQPLRRALQALLGDVAGDEMTAIVHRGGECQRLAAGAGAEINDAHAGAHIGEQGGELRALVLDLDEAGSEGLQRRQRDAIEDA